MPTRTRTVWKPRDDGQFDCRVGWKAKIDGKREQPRFRLGVNLKEAQRRDRVLRQMWERIEENSEEGALWNEESLELAKMVAKGLVHFHVPRQPEEGVVPYVLRVNRMRQAFPMLAILPELEYGAAFGFRLLNSLEDAYAASESSIDAEREKDVAAVRRQLSEGTSPPMVESGPSLHAAMREYIEWLKIEYANPEVGITPWGNTQIGQTESLIAHHPDVSLSRIGRPEVEEMLGYWRKRPYRKGSKQRVSKKSATHYISALRGFFKWLHTSPSFTWRKPEDFNDLKTRVVTLESDRTRQVRPEQLFTLDELKLLYQYGDPMDRLLLLLALNCGFGAAESASLLVGEVFLRTPHSPRHQEMLGVKLAPADSFIKRIRRKSGVYGEFLLFAETVRGLEWAISARKRLGIIKPEDRLLLNSNGQPLDKATIGGNSNKQIPNRFARLLQRIKDNNHSISALPVKMLRKTGGDIVKRFSDGEIGAVFLCHGKPVASDDLSDVYTTRPFGKLFSKLRDVENYLSPVFEVGGENPFGN